jgi:hypothetical protein
MFIQLLTQLLALIKANPEVATLTAGAIFEIITRRQPTEKDYSLINLLKRILDKLAANKKSRKARKKTNPPHFNEDELWY